jgi:RHS repeat-associated protein
MLNVKLFFLRMSYFLKVHLNFFLYISGLKYNMQNTRVTYSPTISGGTINYMLENVVDFYPYGKVLRAYQNGQQEKYLFTQHERDKETGYDNLGARLRDAEVIPFLSLDPKAMKYPSLSPYNYVANNPIMFIDPDGVQRSVNLDGKDQKLVKDNNLYVLANEIQEVTTLELGELDLGNEDSINGGRISKSQIKSNQTENKARRRFGAAERNEKGDTGYGGVSPKDAREMRKEYNQKDNNK